MFPDDGDLTSFVAFNLNYRASPSFAAGGVEIQTWDDGSLSGSASQGSAQCEMAGEQITWTQRMSLAQGAMTYSIEGGESTTWGKFGQGNGLLQVQVNSLANSFDSYSPATSAAFGRRLAGGSSVHVDAAPGPLLLRRQSDRDRLAAPSGGRQHQQLTTSVARVSLHQADRLTATGWGFVVGNVMTMVGWTSSRRTASPCT